jgi:hypothetical protein
MTLSSFQNIFFNFFVRVQRIKIIQQEDRPRNEDSLFSEENAYMRKCVTSLEVLDSICNQDMKRKKKLKKLSHLNFSIISVQNYFFVEITVEVDQCDISYS